MGKENGFGDVSISSSIDASIQKQGSGTNGSKLVLLQYSSTNSKNEGMESQNYPGDNQKKPPTVSKRGFKEHS
jgi:hypothetical protein